MTLKTFRSLIAATTMFCFDSPEASAYPAEAPWKNLERYQETITRREFEHLINRFYNPSKVIYRYMDVNDERAIIYSDASKTSVDFTLRFARDDGSKKPAKHYYKTVQDLNQLKNPANKPLQGLRIALDPGHIGGKWAGMEERQISWANYPLIREGDANLMVSNKVKKRLEALGATVFMTHSAPEPVTSKRPEDFMAEARAEGKTGANLRRRAEMYFYRRQEIYERGELLRNKFNPDFTLSIHFNATELSGNGTVTKDNRHAIFINAAFGPDEVDKEMWRYFMFSKLLERSIFMEGAMGDFLTEEILKVAPLPANAYAWTKYTCPINANPYNNGRNLAMLREFPGPTVLCEFFYMNNPWTAARMTAGDYAGVKYIPGAGGNYRSIYEDYADAVCNAVRRLFTQWTVQKYPGIPPPVITKSSPIRVPPPVAASQNEVASNKP